jgi:hypothetical protein
MRFRDPARAIAWGATLASLGLVLAQGLLDRRYDPTLAVLTVTLIAIIWYTYFTKRAVDHTGRSVELARDQLHELRAEREERAHELAKADIRVSSKRPPTASYHVIAIRNHGPAAGRDVELRFLEQNDDEYQKGGERWWPALTPPAAPDGVLIRKIDAHAKREFRASLSAADATQMQAELTWTDGTGRRSFRTSVFSGG